MPQMIEVDKNVTLRDQLQREVGPVILINTFNVEPEEADQLLQAWAADAAYFKQQPGFISTQLHRGIGGSSVFVNYAVWESVEQLSAAFSSSRSWYEMYAPVPTLWPGKPVSLSAVNLAEQCEALLQNVAVRSLVAVSDDSKGGRDMSNRIIMYWDRVDGPGDPIAGIEILSDEAIEIPADACGFRLGLPNHNWYEGWHFAAPGGVSPFANGGIVYSSAFTGVPSPDAIVATGPVHACTSGSYMFQTPLADFGISGDEPVIAGAGSFVADFSSEDDIEWLDFAGEVIKKADPEEEKPKKKPAPKLPPEFFEQLPRLRPCIRDFEEKLHCYPPPPPPQAPMLPDRDALTIGVRPPPGIALLVAAGSGILPQVKAMDAPAGAANDTPQGSKLEVTCPAELVLTATFFKDHTFEPAIVAYRFRFAHGPVSTVFSTLVDQDGENTVFHSVPIPLPPPIGGTPGGGGGVPPGPGTVAVVVRPIEPINPGGSGPPTHSHEFTVEALPGNEHKSSVRVEVVNAFEGVVASEWATYHLVCVPGSHRPGLLPGSLGVMVTSLQAGLNRWLKSQKRTPLKVDGVFGPRTEAAVRAFQKDRRLEVDGEVGTKTWREVLSQK